MIVVLGILGGFFLMALLLALLGLLSPSMALFWLSGSKSRWKSAGIYGSAAIAVFLIMMVLVKQFALLPSFK